MFKPPLERTSYEHYIVMMRCFEVMIHLSQTQAKLHEKESLGQGQVHAGGDTGRVERHDASPRDRGDGATTMSTQGDNPLVAIAKAKENLLRAQIEQYKKKKPEGRDGEVKMVCD